MSWHCEPFGNRESIAETSFPSFAPNNFGAVKDPYFHSIPRIEKIQETS